MGESDIENFKSDKYRGKFSIALYIEGYIIYINRKADIYMYKNTHSV